MVTPLKIPNVGTSPDGGLLGLTVFNNSLYAAWKGVGNDQGIYWSNVSFTNWKDWENASWAAQQKIPKVGTSVGPALAVYQNKLYGAWKGAGGDEGIYWSAFDGNSWSAFGAPQAKIPSVGTTVGPSLAVYKNKLYAAWKGIKGDDGIYWSAFDGTAWSAFGPAQAKVPNVGTNWAPSIAAIESNQEDKLYAAWAGINNEGIYWSTFDGTNWAAQQKIPYDQGVAGPSIGVPLLPTSVWAFWLQYVGAPDGGPGSTGGSSGVGGIPDTGSGQAYPIGVYCQSYNSVLSGGDGKWDPQDPIPIPGPLSVPAIANYLGIWFGIWGGPVEGNPPYYGINWGPLLELTN